MSWGAELYAEEVILCGLPCFTSMGLLLPDPFLSPLAPCVILSAQDTDNRDEKFYNIVQHYQAVAFSAVPTILSCSWIHLKGSGYLLLRYLFVERPLFPWSCLNDLRPQRNEDIEDTD